MNEMMVELNCSEDRLVRQGGVEKGAVVTLKFEDGMWYRVQVQSVNGDSCLVFFVDFGNRIKAALSDLHALPQTELSSIPFQAIHCRLDGQSGQSHAAIETGLKSLEEQSILVRVLRKDRDNVNVVEICGQDGSSLFQDVETETKAKSEV